MASTEVMTIDIAKIELGNPNEVEPVQTPASSRSEEERVLIEKDGRFELVKADDIRASPIDSITPLAMQPNHHKTEPKTTNKIIPCARSTQSSKNFITPKPTDPGKRLEPRTSPPRVQGLGTTGSSPSLLQPRRRPLPSTQPFSPSSSPKRDVRPRTAPLVAKTSSYFSLSGSERRELAEKAFESWLNQKDRQLSESVKNRGGTPSPDSDSERQRRIADAYRSWMDNKKKQVLGEFEAKKRKKSTLTKTGDSVTFERWLKEKSQSRKTKRGSKVTLTFLGEQK